MEFPHKTYLLYLLSRQMEPADVRADCITKGLIPPGDLELSRMYHHDLGGSIPKFWRAKVTRENTKFRRWLRDLGVLHLWKRDLPTEQAFDFVYRKAPRKDFEAIVLAHGDVEQARRELLVKYPERLIPSEAALMRFYDIFWNVGAMSSEGLLEYLTAEDAREDYLPALEGDLVSIYGRLGLQQKVKGETFLQNVLEAANQQALRLRSDPNISGALLAGIATVMKVGIEANKLLEEQNILDASEASMRDEAADFLASVVQATRIPSVDEINRGDVIDADYAEAGNVHRLPLRGE